MTELIDNTLQLFIVVVCGIYSGMSALKNRSYSWLFVTLFYLSFGIGLTYWVLYIILFASTPRVFCVSELSWTASYIFLAIRLAAELSDEERNYKPKLARALPLFSLGMCIFFCQRGSYLENILMGTALAVCGFLAARGLMFAIAQNRTKRRYICMAVLIFIAAEYLLWVSSYFWLSDTFFNPYFLMDTFVLNPALILVAIMQKRQDRA